MSSFLSKCFDFVRCFTSTLHFRRSTWWFLFVVECLSLFVAFFLGFYCASSERCPSKGYWPTADWGPAGTESGWLCERLTPENLIKSPIGALSNVSFVLVGWIILVFGFEDYYYFHHSSVSAPKHELQDYERGSPPNLVLAASGAIHLLFSLLGCLCLFYAGLGAFLYHASFTDVGGTYDLASVWTLTTIILPYCALNHFFIIKDLHPFWGVRILVALACGGMLYTFVFPFNLPQSVDQYEVVPITAGMTFVLQATYYSLCCRRVTIRAKSDFLHLPVAAAFMLTAYHLQLHDNDIYCYGPDSMFQAHGAWHCGMAIGVMFVYFFLRQERQREGKKTEEANATVRSGSDEGDHELMTTTREALV